MIRLEHANLHVRDVDETIRFLRTAFPEIRIRGEGRNFEGARWVHVGTDDTYLALVEASRASARRREPYAPEPGMNHLGFEVSDAAGLRARMRAAGYRESTVPNAHPHRARVYFSDAEGNDWEFVEYRSDDPAERNDYALGDEPSAGDGSA